MSKVYNGFIRLISAIFFSISVGIFTFNDVYANSFETDASAAEKFLMGCIVKCIKNPVNLEFFVLEGYWCVSDNIMLSFNPAQEIICST